MCFYDLNKSNILILQALTTIFNTYFKYHYHSPTRSYFTALIQKICLKMTNFSSSINHSRHTCCHISYALIDLYYNIGRKSQSLLCSFSSMSYCHCHSQTQYYAHYRNCLPIMLMSTQPSLGACRKMAKYLTLTVASLCSLMGKYFC